MKKSLTCPKCDGRKIVHVPKLMQDTQAGMSPLPVAARRGVLGTRRPIGAFEAFICASCGYSELYASNVQAILDLGEGTRLIDNEPKATLR